MVAFTLSSSFINVAPSMLNALSTDTLCKNEVSDTDKSPITDNSCVGISAEPILAAGEKAVPVTVKSPFILISSVEKSPQIKGVVEVEFSIYNLLLPVS